MKKSLYLTETKQSKVYKTFILLLFSLYHQHISFSWSGLIVLYFSGLSSLGQKGKMQNCCIIAQEIFWKVEMLIVLAKVSTLHDLDFNL